MALNASLPQRWERHLFRGLVLALVLSSSSMLVSSCLTPDFNFDPPAIGIGGNGGGTAATSAGGDGDTGAVNEKAHCKNLLQDEDETDEDCGGRDCERCAPGSTCRISMDCAGVDCIEGFCQTSRCRDEFQNDDESDKNCGGDTCPGCAPGLKCRDGNDCLSLVCTDGICAESSCKDGVRNQGESGADCGGPCSPCDIGLPCRAQDECQQPKEGEGEVSCDKSEKICTIDCPTGFEDCNKRAEDGCEVDTRSDLEHCGACEAACDPNNAVDAICDDGECTFESCEDGFADCNVRGEDGCEVDLLSDMEHCGSCTVSCSGNHGEASCESGSCSIDCEDNYQDCDLDPGKNGCEFDLDDLGSVDDCTACGDKCTGTNPFCDGKNGCKQRLDAAVTEAWFMQGPSNTNLTFNINIPTGPGTNRALVVLLASAAQLTVRLGATDIPVLHDEVVETQGISAIHLMLDQQLGAAGAKQVFISGGWGGRVAAVLLLENVAQVKPSATKLGSKLTDGATTGSNTTLTAQVTDPKSIVVGSLLVRGPGQVTGTMVGFSDTFSSTYQSEQANGFLAYRENVGSSLEVGWKDIGIGAETWGSGLVTATFDAVTTAGP